MPLAFDDAALARVMIAVTAVSDRGLNTHCHSGSIVVGGVAGLGVGFVAGWGCSFVLLGPPVD
jgi:hypothetical protein